MTCMVGLVQEGKVYMGVDSGSSNGLDQHVDKMPKLFRLGEMLIGFTTSWRMGQILQYHVDVPKEDVPLEEYVVRHFIPAAREALKEHGFTEIDNNREGGGFFLIGIGGRLFVVQDDFSIMEPVDHFAAIGGGAHYALGAMWTSGAGPKGRVRDALRAAEHFSSGVLPPFVIMESTDLGWREV